MQLKIKTVLRERKANGQKLIYFQKQAEWLKERTSLLCDLNSQALVTDIFPWSHSPQRKPACLTCVGRAAGSNEVAEDVKIFFSSYVDPKVYLPKFINWIFALQCIYISAKSAF